MLGASAASATRKGELLTSMHSLDSKKIYCYSIVHKVLLPAISNQFLDQIKLVSGTVQLMYWSCTSHRPIAHMWCQLSGVGFRPVGTYQGTNLLHKTCEPPMQEYVVCY